MNCHFFNCEVQMMKISISLVLITMLFIGCGKKDESKLTAFSPEAFAYQLDKGWEVDATTRIKGFEQKESENKFKVSISFSVDLVTPTGKIIKDVDKKITDKTENEKIMDIPLETQFDLDTTYLPGNYKVVFNIKDVNTQQTTTSTAGFKLGE